MRNRIGIVRETKNSWERRVPLIPADLEKLISKYAINAVIQPSDNRIFTNEAYLKIGALVEENLSDCDVILGIKEIKSEDLIPDKAYLYFSHTIKGQSYNMPMLQKLLDLNCTLIDYERMVDQNDQRLIYFSYHAGVAGIIDTIWSLGQRLAWEGINSPFINIKQTLNYADQKEAESDFNKLADIIRSKGLPQEILPFVIGITGYGNVSRGVQDILDLLPVKEIQINDLQEIENLRSDHSKIVYKVVFSEKDMVKPVSAESGFDLEEYYNYPERYQADFEQYLPYLTVLVNASFWDTIYPRHVPNNALYNLYRIDESPSLRVIGDISCDIEGGIECTRKATDPGNPVFVYNPKKDDIIDGVAGNGPVIMAVDNLPSELPRDASIYFSSVLKDMIPDLVKVDFTQDFEKLDLPFSIKKAVIAHKGKLAKEYVYLYEYL